MENIKAYSAFALVIIGVILTLFFTSYNGHLIPYPWLWAILSAGGVYFFIKLIRSKLTAEQKETMSRIEDLKANGQRYTVDLSQCEVIGWTQTSELEAYEGPRRYGPPETIHVPEGSHVLSTRREGHALIKEIETSESRVIYNMELRAKPHQFFSQSLRHDKISVTFLMAAQKTTTLYVDKNDPTHYYLDMEFLDS